MKQVILLLAVVLTMASCGTRKGYFSIEGRFLNLNQGEFYVYSPDGVIGGVDTIKVNGGRFAMEIPCQRDGVLMLVFPNFSEQPIFAESGEGVDIKADASHLKQMEVSGTDDNKLMTDFRQAIASAAPPEVMKLAEHFVRDNAKSAVAVYLLGKYFVVSGNTAALKKAKELLPVVKKAQPKNGNLVRMENSVKMLLAANVGDRLPSFSATDVNGKPLSPAMLTGKKTVVCTWASWSYDSQNMMRRIKAIVDSKGGSVAAIGICLDASSKECRETVKREIFSFPNVCDEKLFDGTLLMQLGLHSVPANIIVGSDGRVVARNVGIDDLEHYLE